MVNIKLLNEIKACFTVGFEDIDHFYGFDSITVVKCDEDRLEQIIGKTEVARLTTIVEGANHIQDKWEEERKAYIDKIDRLTAEVNEWKTEIDRLNRVIENLNDDCKTTAFRYENAEKENVRQSDRIKELEKINEELRRKLKEKTFHDILMKPLGGTGNIPRSVKEFLENEDEWEKNE